ncbi:metallophosphoesterase family protein [Zhouia amylolytica]|uniref:metallophosphoesterase family protein n=1 Tax=Zhouia amylolytica TaxID=376730 RepID=UPI0020CE7181|nr:metallophosphoesterase [Zhouia amylolytica]MCQ0111163.1 metallophosphoesterase [Zhouia amylolytica]
MNDRRAFLKGALATSIVISLPSAAFSLFDKGNKPLRVGMITDLHEDIMHDGLLRMEAFLKVMKRKKPDALIQLGDFAYPGDKNKEVIELFNNAHPNTLHVIGNHDMDAGYTREQCVDYWGMPDRFYVRKINGVSFVVLDGNDKGSPVHKGGYASYINEMQYQWLEQQLEQIDGPVVIVSHQPLAGAYAIDNAEQVQGLLAKHSDKILVAVNGHTHIDAHLEVQGIHYVHINSASYYWVGGKFQHDSYDESILKEHKYISYTCPYKEALFTLMTIDPKSRTISFSGKSSRWVGESPEELGFEGYENAIPGKEIVPEIRKREIKS